MNSFAFIAHYLSLGHFCELVGWPGVALRHMRSDVLKRIIKVLPPYLFLRLPPLPSRGDSPTEGFGIITPFLPEHVITWGEAQVLQKVVAGCQLAKQLGAKIVGLAG